MFKRVRIKKLPQARTGYQVQGSLANDVPAFGGADYNSYIGIPDPKVSKYMTGVPREEANLEAEGGETVFGDINGDGIPEHKIIKGPRHSSGGVPLALPDDTFIFSDTRAMKIKDPNILAMFNKPMKKGGYTPADLAKAYDLDKYRKILQDPNSDAIDRKTAELMIRNYNVKLGALALAQESKKGFPQGIPKVAFPALEAMGVSEEDLLPPPLPAPINPNAAPPQDQQMMPQQGMDPQAAMAEQMNQGQPVAMPSPEDQQMMAQFGMTMGGFDMPYAEYGMQMGITSKNFQGRAQDGMFMSGEGIPSYDNLGHTMTRDKGSMPAMQGGGTPPDGIIVKRSDYADDAAYQMALKKAQYQAQKSGKKVYSQNASGKYAVVTAKPAAPTEFAGDVTPWSGKKDMAARYAAMEKALEDPVMAKMIADETRKALKNKEAYKGKSGSYGKTWEERGYGSADQLSDAELVDAFKELNKRNLMLKASGNVSFMYKDANGMLRDWDSKGNGQKDNLGFKDLMMQQGFTEAQAKAQYDKMKAEAPNLDKAFDKLGIPMSGVAKGTPNEKKALLQQASFIGYDNLMKAYNAGTLSEDQAIRAMDFRGNLQGGYKDETGQGVVDISPIDAYYTNTTAGEIADIQPIKFEETLLDEPCPACPDGTLPNRDAVTGECPCKEKSKAERDCECTKADGTKMISYIDDTTGECSQDPCQEIQRRPDVPAPWWLQDTIKTGVLAGDYMGVKKYMPWAPDPRLVKPRPTFLDPTRELAQQSEQANILTQGMAQFAGPQQLSARASSVQGQAAKQAADTLSRYNNANVQLANQFEMKSTDIENQETLMRQASQQKLYDQNTIANQQYDNSKRALRNALTSQYTNAITNRWKTHALNQMYPQFQVDPAIGGRAGFNGQDKKITPGTPGMTYDKAYDWCKSKGDKDPAGCADKMLKNQRGNSGTGFDPSSAFEAQYAYAQKGGYVLGDTIFPFMFY